MARTHFVKKTQARFQMVPATEPDGSPKYATRTLARPTKRGVTESRVRVTVPDLTKPIAPPTCDHCRKVIEYGSPAKWVKPKSGPYGGSKRWRHAACPNWQSWDLSNSLSAMLDQAADQFGKDLDAAEDEDGLKSATEQYGQAIQELADQKREGADNIESGFGHETYQSQELSETADNLENAAQTISDWEPSQEAPEEQEEEIDCDECEGSGKVDNPEFPGLDHDEPEEIDCEVCDGTGQVENDEYDPDAMENWLQEMRDEAQALQDEVQF